MNLGRFKHFLEPQIGHIVISRCASIVLPEPAAYHLARYARLPQPLQGRVDMPLAFTSLKSISWPRLTRNSLPSLLDYPRVLA
jgi:hypothetical protein